MSTDTESSLCGTHKDSNDKENSHRWLSNWLVFGGDFFPLCMKITSVDQTHLVSETVHTSRSKESNPALRWWIKAFQMSVFFPSCFFFLLLLLPPGRLRTQLPVYPNMQFCLVANITLGRASNRLDYIDREDVFGDWKLNGLPRGMTLHLFCVPITCVFSYCICWFVMSVILHYHLSVRV